jgi:hypothetical protein
MSFLWPTTLKAEPTFLGRLGRLVHWLFVAGCVLMVWMAFRRPSNEWFTTELIGVPFVFLLGRGLRYLLSAE